MSESSGIIVHEIVAEHLKANGYDGLYADECGCELSDLAPCGEMKADCMAGYKGPCTPGCINGGDCDWHVGPEKPADGDKIQAPPVEPIDWDHFDETTAIEFPHDPNKKLENQ